MKNVNVGLSPFKLASRAGTLEVAIYTLKVLVLPKMNDLELPLKQLKTKKRKEDGDDIYETTPTKVRLNDRGYSSLLWRPW